MNKKLSRQIRRWDNGAAERELAQWTAAASQLESMTSEEIVALMNRPFIPIVEPKSRQEKRRLARAASRGHSGQGGR